MRITKSIKQEIEDSHSGAVLALRRAAVIGGLIVLAAVCAALAGCGRKKSLPYISRSEQAEKYPSPHIRKIRWQEEILELRKQYELHTPRMVFNAERPCEKCGRVGASFSYEPEVGVVGFNHWMHNYPHPEFMFRECKCGYSWIEIPLRLGRTK